MQKVVAAFANSMDNIIVVTDAGKIYRREVVPSADKNGHEAVWDELYSAPLPDIEVEEE